VPSAATTTHHLHIASVIAAAIVGAIVGNVVAFLTGRVLRIQAVAAIRQLPSSE